MVSKIIEKHFLSLALALSVVALFQPQLFVGLKPHIPKLLGLVMFGMGLTLTTADFKGVLTKWRLIGIGTGLHFTIMPLTAFAISRLFQLSDEVTIGMVIVGACPSGTASNVITYLARANVALAVGLTLVSTFLAPILTPAIVYLLMKKSISIPVWDMMQSTFWIVLFPLLDALILRRLLQKRIEKMVAIFPSISILAITVIIATIVALNQKTLLTFPLLILAAVICHNAAGLALGYLLSKLAKANETEARTISIEVGTQNSGLGVTLASSFFSPAAALPGALFSLWQNLAGIVLATFWRRNINLD